jgi:hypothetical protein
VSIERNLANLANLAFADAGLGRARVVGLGRTDLREISLISLSG